MNGRIIRILDDHTVVLNVGLTEGAKPRQRFGIYTPSDKIVDPQTNEELGEYRRLKGVVVVEEVFERFAVASAPKIREEVVEETGIGIGLGFGTRRRRKTQTMHDLDVGFDQIRGLPTGDEVRVGDLVELLDRPAKSD